MASGFRAFYQYNLPIGNIVFKVVPEAAETEFVTART
jgi:hypothetical protein